ncbi:MAG TPA: hypothetical protein PK822_09095 [Bacillota bacterium]|jgi:hypothetical protein|nr:hypothetical protein [Bacillota bacterium]
MYPWTEWRDHVTSPSNRFVVVDNKDGTYTITPTGEVMQQGTPQDQVRFNNIEAGIVDVHTALNLLMNYALQNAWEIEEGVVTLQNNLAFPFNDSVQTVSLERKIESDLYIVLPEIVSAVGNPGEIVVSDKLVNGFKIAHTGSAKSVTVKYKVIGGNLK